MLHPFRSCLALAAALAAANASAGILLQENFEDASLDGRIAVSTVGTFVAGPGVKAFTGLEGTQAFGFGRSVNRFNSFGNYVTNLTIDLGSSMFVDSLSFDEMEVLSNWGSRGEVYVDGALLAPSPSFGRSPYNDFVSDTTFRSHTYAINGLARTIMIQVWDITDLSEIYIDRISLTGDSPAAVPLPGSATLVIPALLALAWQRKRSRNASSLEG